VDSPLKRRLMGLALSCSYLVFVVIIAFAEATTPDPLSEKVVVEAALALFIAAYVAFWYTSMNDRGWTCERSPLRTGLAVGLCAIATCLSFLDFQVFGSLLIYCGVSIVGLFSARRGWLAAVGTAVASVAFILATGSKPGDWFWLPLVILISALGVSFGRRMSEYGTDLRMAREEIARLAVSEERLRFARDLHDLLGHSLSVVVLKAELAGRLATSSPERAVEEMADVERVAREALREVRDAVVGYRQPSLDQELEGARRTLQSAGVLARFEPVTGPLPASLDATLAWALREGVTNIVRHSRARHAEVILARDDGQVRLELLDDGVGCDGCAPGNGLKGLRERVEARDGSLDWGPRSEGGFRLAVTLPVKEAPRAAEVRVGSSPLSSPGGTPPPRGGRSKV
jgi:two-component system sensor histidine kinase DesK